MKEQFLKSLWSPPDPVLASAGMAGEVLVAKVRLGLASVLLLIPLINVLFFPINLKEVIVGVSLTVGTFLFSALIYWSLARQFNPSWLSFATSGFDVTLVSAGLILFLVMNEPHTAVNSKVVFEGYFLAIAASSIRYDTRVSIITGLLSLGEYMAIVLFTALHWDLNSPAYAPYEYGVFNWSAQISRFIILLIASALGVALVARSQRLLQLATRDPVTGLFNRAYVDDRFEVELTRAKRYGNALTIAIIDADHFKQLNDAHGHLAGDIVLKRLGELLNKSFRQSDIAGRYGGEEFMILLPDANMNVAVQRLEHLRRLVEKTPILVPSAEHQVQVTFSAGLASFPQDGNRAAKLFAVADERMFDAKRSGRNRIVTGTTEISVSQNLQVPEPSGVGDHPNRLMKGRRDD